MQDSQDRESSISFRTRAAIAVAFILATVVVAEGLAAGGGVWSVSSITGFRSVRDYSQHAQCSTVPT